MRCWQSGQLQERTAGGREFQILGDATEKLRAPNDVCANRRVSRLVLEDLIGNEQECESAERNVNMQAVDNAK